MFDLSKRKYVYQPKVKDLISILENENPDAIITIDALDEFFIHVTEDDHHVGIDLSELEKNYREDYKNKNTTYPEKLNRDTLKPFKISQDISKSECLELLTLIINNVSHQFLLNHGFTQKQIDLLKGDTYEQ